MYCKVVGGFLGWVIKFNLDGRSRSFYMIKVSDILIIIVMD